MSVKIEIIKLLDEIIVIEDKYGDYTTEDYLAMVINKAIEIKEIIKEIK